MQEPMSPFLIHFVVWQVELANALWMILTEVKLAHALRMILTDVKLAHALLDENQRLSL